MIITKELFGCDDCKNLNDFYKSPRYLVSIPTHRYFIQDSTLNVTTNFTIIIAFKLK